MLCRPRADERQRPAIGDLRRERHGGGNDVAVDHAIEQALSRHGEHFAGTASPLTIRFRAVSTSIARGSRCVPPAPGTRPIFTSGRPMRVPRCAMR